ncbi:hypothetical protein H2202_008337 [Exophiala xenobiotica]|nr:hypothetical protein H2202_008337 [Exophiala xenobiotica]KAK5230497.1 hypothetical protein LTR47_007639 [Exophiala xenobiotica]KAK5247036.1 hypothetical protein LTS06_007739 [Exophiala xenobiotica]KAK5315309.1 hypothetical protein LTR93_009941 [Exophiala xenobiotica]KAK5346126.1 hypothetical protein LTR61_010163 [Exophiala xenobiotica]
MDVLSKALESPIPISISVLSDLGKGALRKALLDASEDDDVHPILNVWPRLVLTAKDSQVVDKHLTSASNALCVFLNGAAASRNSKIYRFVTSKQVWFDAFQCAEKAFDDGRTKPAFQVLETLCDLLRKMSGQDSIAEILTTTTLPLIRIILLCSPRSDLKKACLMLTCFCRKTPIIDHLERLIGETTAKHSSPWEQRLMRHSITATDVSEIGNGGMPSLFLALIFASIDIDVRSTATKTLSTLCSRGSGHSNGADLQTLAERVVGLYLKRNHEARGEFAQNVLPVVLSDKTRFMAFVKSKASSCCDGEAELALFLSTLRVGASNNILSETEAVAVLNTVFLSQTSAQSPQQDHCHWIKYILKLASSEIQIMIYGLLAASRAAHAIIHTDGLDCIASSLKYLHNNADAHDRGEILSITKRLLKRVQIGCSALCKRSQQNANDSGNEATLASYQSFTAQYYNFLRSELGTGVSYPRHILALQSLQYFFSLSMKPDMFLSDHELTRSLCNLSLDPFEDVRDLSASLLEFIASETPELVSRTVNPTFLHDVEMLALHTGRGDHADGMGRLWTVRFRSIGAVESAPAAADRALMMHISRLENMLSRVGSLQPGSDFPLHGSLLALNYQLRNLKGPKLDATSDAARILDLCHRIWNEVRLQLCVDSPERTSDLADDDGTEGPKDLLAYSWRALRDSSLVVQALVMATRPSKELFSLIGNLCMDELMSLRHRGAFSTVANTFLLCCETVRNAVDPGIRELLHKWYKVALSQIDEQADRLTRRSAGLPAMMTALLSPADTEFFSGAISDLMDIAGQSPQNTTLSGEGLRLPQVHALNCLKDIMTASRFSVIVIRFLSPIVRLAAACLSSKIWGIRNCGLMLLRACINRLDSSHKNENIASQDSKQAPADDSPSLVAIHLLESAHRVSDDDPDNAMNATELVFAGLDLLGHTRSKDSENTEMGIVIARELSNPTWAVRDHAAFQLAHCLSNLGPILAVQRLLEVAGPAECGNRTHGIMLCLQYIMKVGIETLTESELERILPLLGDGLATTAGTINSRSPYVNAAWLDILNDAAVLIANNGWRQQMLSTSCSQDYLRSLQTLNSAHSPFLTHRLLLHKVFLHMLRDEDMPSHGQTVQSLGSELADDPEAMCFVLDTINEKLASRPRLSLFDLFAYVVNESYDTILRRPDVLAKAFYFLELFFASSIRPDLESLRLVSEKIDFRQLASTRDLWNATLRLEAHILGLVVLPGNGGTAARLRTNSWLDAIEYASMDYLDFPTRLSAAAAISTLLGHLLPANLDHDRRDIRLRLLLVVYDLLNDDDEEVRAEAVAAAGKLDLQHVSNIGGLGLCALAAREALIEELGEQYGQERLLTEAALAKVMRVGWDSESSFFEREVVQLFEASVSSRLAGIIKSKTDLFAEERQNLYIDDIREIEGWTKVLDQSAYRQLPQEQLQPMFVWISGGLDQVLAMLQVEQKRIDRGASFSISTFVHPLGVTYDHELLVVFLQVISLAGVLLNWEATADLKAQVHGRLEQLHLLCMQTQCNEVLVGAVNSALGKVKVK